MTRIREIVFALASAFTVCIVAADTTNNYCSNGTECCKDYFRRDDGLCHPCENGTFGINCGLRCPRFFYGRFCDGRCNCSGGFDCDPRNGKCDYGEDKIGDNAPFQIWIIVLASIGVIVLFVGLLGCCLASQRRQPTSNYKDLSTVHAFLDLLARRAFRPESSNYCRTRTVEGGDVQSRANQASSYQYIDTPLLNNIPTTPNREPRLVDEVSRREEERGASSSTDLMKRILERRIAEKSSGFVQVHKWKNKQNKAEDICCSKVEQRSKSRAFSHIRRGIRSVFRNLEASYEINSDKNDGSENNLNWISDAKLPPDLVEKYLRDNYEGNKNRRSDDDLLNTRNQPKESGGQPNLSPKEWLSENVSQRVFDGPSEKTDNDKTGNAIRKGKHNQPRRLRSTAKERFGEKDWCSGELLSENPALSPQNVIQTDRFGYLIPVTEILEAQDIRLIASADCTAYMRKGKHNQPRRLRSTAKERFGEKDWCSGQLLSENPALGPENIIQTDSFGYLIPVTEILEAKFFQ